MPWYFAYGSNLNKKRLRGRVGNWEDSKKGILENYELSFDSRGYADAIEKPEGRVFGVVYLLTDKQLEMLDKYEGVHSGVYSRETVKINVNGEKLSAITYIRARKTAFSKPPVWYLELIISGLMEHNFDNTIIEEVKKASRARI